MFDPPRYQLGDLLPLNVWAVTVGGTQTAPDAAPTAKIYAASDVTTPVKTVSLPIDDRYGALVRFHTMDNLDGDYSTGTYHVIYEYAHSSVGNGGREDFEVVAGGDAMGSVIASECVDRPTGRHVVFALDDGSIRVSRNPR